jgi:glycoprotein-mannosyl O6-kinase
MFNETQIGCTADCHVGCPEGTYRLPGMVECKPRLNCDQIRNLTKGRNLIGGGGVKRIYTADLQGSSVVIARVKRFKFNQYLDSMVELQQTGIVAQLIGMCEEPAWPEVVLQYHSLGSLLTVSQLPDVLSLRWRIIMSYLDVVEKLHNRVPRSPRVLCDASRTEITLSQFLLTDDFRVVLNDVDELIAAGADGKVRCNCNIIRGGSEFDENGERPGGCLVPPEQKQCGTNIYYTEKIDIWKIPDITRAIIGDSPEGLSVWDELHRLHQECKNSNPNMRPPIEYVVDKYKQLQYKMQIPSYH